MPRSEREPALVGVRFSRGSNDRGGQAPALRARKGFAFRSFRTLMSIARADAVSSRSFRSLMCSAAMHLLQIKDLKDLSVFFGWGYYGHAGPKEPEEIFFTGVIARDKPPRYGEKKRAVYRRARACPSPCLDRNEKRPWLAFGFRLGRTIAGDRPPRYGPGRDSPRHAPFGIRRARTTVSCL